MSNQYSFSLDTEEVFQTALTKARADEGWYPRIVAEYLFYARSLHSLQPEDYGWLKELAENNIVPACCLLLLGMDRKTRDWEETFIDEDTGEEVKVLREEIIDGTLFEPDDKLKEQLVQTIYDKAEIHYLGIDDIRIACCYPLNTMPLRLWKSSSTTSASNLALQVMKWDSTCHNRY